MAGADGFAKRHLRGAGERRKHPTASKWLDRLFAVVKGFWQQMPAPFPDLIAENTHAFSGFYRGAPDSMTF